MIFVSHIFVRFWHVGIDWLVGTNQRAAPVEPNLWLFSFLKLRAGDQRLGHFSPIYRVRKARTKEIAFVDFLIFFKRK